MGSQEGGGTALVADEKFAADRNNRQIRVVALRHDLTAYRWWDAAIEHQTGGELCAMTPPGTAMNQPDKVWMSGYWARHIFWTDRFYNLVELYHPDGTPHELYVNVASPIVIAGDEVRYQDYELDVVQGAGEAPVILDADEFLAAMLEYGYDDALLLKCLHTVREVVKLLPHWRWRGAPRL